MPCFQNETHLPTWYFLKNLPATQPEKNTKYNEQEHVLSNLHFWVQHVNFFGGVNIQTAVWIISPRYRQYEIHILPKTNIAPEERWLEDYFPFWETRADDKIPTSGST